MSEKIPESVSNTFGGPNRRLRLLLVPFLLAPVFPAQSQESPPGGALAGERPRVIVSSDIGGSDPDDFQSMVHLFVKKKADIKMGDSPSVLYLLRGRLDDPTSASWGGAYIARPGRPHAWKDDPAQENAEGDRPGAKTVNRWRVEYLTDWKMRMDRVLER